MEDIYQQLLKGIKNYFHQSKLSRVVVGVSGGIDSSLTLKLAVDALGSEKVTAISMPEIGISSAENIKHAKMLSKALDVDFFSQPINAFLSPFKQVAWKGNQTAAINLKARIRAVLLYHYANSHQALVLGTSNKSEILLGYGTKYGDLAADLEVIGDLYKEDVYALADYLELPQEILEKKPTAELYPNQTDEGELGASYSELDPILKRLDAGLDELISRGLSATLVHNVLKRVEQNKHKSELPPIVKVKRLS